MATKRTRYVYFFKDLRTELIKIGTSIEVERRKKTLKREKTGPLVCLGVIIGGFEVENGLHKKFKYLQVHHEWFRADPYLLRFISEWAAKNREYAETVDLDRELCLSVLTPRERVQSPLVSVRTQPDEARLDLQDSLFFDD